VHLRLHQRRGSGQKPSHTRCPVKSITPLGPHHVNVIIIFSSHTSRNMEPRN
jgi:hypothetical protein